ncbi:MAG: hypothetical protein ACQEQF_10245 [Bacillota bacterium]
MKKKYLTLASRIKSELDETNNKLLTEIEDFTDFLEKSSYE